MTKCNVQIGDSYAAIRTGISKFGGSAFPKLNWTSPRVSPSPLIVSPWLIYAAFRTQRSSSPRRRMDRSTVRLLPTSTSFSSRATSSHTTSTRAPLIRDVMTRIKRLG
jgi:hypothetical protein